MECLGGYTTKSNLWILLQGQKRMEEGTLRDTPSRFPVTDGWSLHFASVEFHFGRYPPEHPNKADGMFRWVHHKDKTLQQNSIEDDLTHFRRITQDIGSCWR